MQKSDRRILVIDAGNTAVKCGLFADGILAQVQRFHTASFLNDPRKNFDEEFDVVVFSSVLGHDDTQTITNAFGNVFQVVSDCNTGLEMAYESPQTLGMDRLCNAVAARNLCSTTYAVSVDIGTCIKFDVVEKNTYLGGSISPGIDLRYKSLHNYTAKLPLINEKIPVPLTGRSTKASIHSGVINGMQAEIEGLIRKYNTDFRDLTFFITGGDSCHFDLAGKNNIFADENLTLKGLYYIYLANVH
jgi:type III pantothenate kinase